MRIVGIILFALLAFLWLLDAIRKRRDKKRGYSIELVSPGVLRAGEDDYAIVYKQVDVQFWFYGQKINDVIIFDDNPNIKSDEDQELWSRSRETIKQRIFTE